MVQVGGIGDEAANAGSRDAPCETKVAPSLKVGDEAREAFVVEGGTPSR
jgi:hypothetical protein